jgi:small conductance mechanosensitive channel
MVTTWVTEWGLKVIGAIAVLIVGRMVAGSVRRGVSRLLTRGNMDVTVVPFLSGITYYLLMAVVIVAVLSMIGIQTASLIAVLGAAGLAIGLALQGTLSNLSAGVMLLVFRPFRVGDYVEVGGTSGSVQSVGLFASILHTPDNVQIIVPNSQIFGNTVKNYAANPTRRNDMVMGIAYDDDIGVAIKTIQETIQADKRVLDDPAPVVAVSELGDSSVNLVIRPWCKKEDYWALRFDLTRALKERLEAAGCSIPFPQRDVHLYEVKTG